ncbi:hypothetical protein [Metabacillus litoralis]|uniref:hypothetical protein n=1 Tax=Metabacillus litoralis TaxID=152268 RepID=UPI00203F8A80|nr:hypothetical protein [Metabacillus litoralis]MCM3411229.1 hypothetical protein [Metabacillus litoralis]
MSINEIIINALNFLNIPVRFQKILDQDGDPSNYVTFFEYNQNGALHGDDSEIKSNHFIQIDVWSNGNYSDIVKQIKEKLTEIGFIRTYEKDLYETDTKKYHKVIRFNFVQ